MIQPGLGQRIVGENLLINVVGLEAEVKSGYLRIRSFGDKKTFWMTIKPLLDQFSSLLCFFTTSNINNFIVILFKFSEIKNYSRYKIKVFDLIKSIN